MPKSFADEKGLEIDALTERAGNVERLVALHAENGELRGELLALYRGLDPYNLRGG